MPENPLSDLVLALLNIRAQQAIADDLAAQIDRLARTVPTDRYTSAYAATEPEPDPDALYFCPCGCRSELYLENAQGVARERRLPFIPVRHNLLESNPHDGYGSVNGIPMPPYTDAPSPDPIPEEDIPVPVGTDPRRVTTRRGRTYIAPRPVLPLTVEDAQVWEDTCLAAWREDNSAATRTALFRAVCDTDTLAIRGNASFRESVRRFVSLVGSRMSSRRYAYGPVSERYGVRFCSPRCVTEYGPSNERWYDREVDYMNTTPGSYNSESWEVLDRTDPRVVERGRQESGFCAGCYRTLGTLPGEVQYHVRCTRCQGVEWCHNGTTDDGMCDSCARTEQELSDYCYGCGYCGTHAPGPHCTGEVDADDVAALIASFAPMVTPEPTPAPTRTTRGRTTSQWDLYVGQWVTTNSMITNGNTWASAT